MSLQSSADGSGTNGNNCDSVGTMSSSASNNGSAALAGAAGAGAGAGMSGDAAAALLEGSSSVYQAWSRSYVELYTIAHEWTVDNFIELDEEATITFKVAIEGNEELRFKLSLKPKYGENRDYISLYVHNLNKKELKYSLNFNILDKDKDRKLTRRADTRVHAPNESWGFPKFCQRAEVVDHPTTMLPESTLTVLCEIGGFKRITNRSDYQRVRENFDCDSLPGLREDMTQAFGDMDHADMELYVDGQSFPCHKFVMGSRSDVFRAMFSHDMRESKENRVEVTDASPDVVRQFLKFIYTDAIDDTGFKTVSQLLPLAEKYNVKKLSNECGQRLLEAMCVENVSEVAVIGQVYNVPLLKNKAIEFISQYPERVMKTSGWQILLKDAPDVCTSIICRLSRVGCEKEVVVKSASRSSNQSNSGN